LFDWQTHMRQQARWLLELSRDPGFREHARLRLAEMLADPLYVGFADIWREVFSEQVPQREDDR
jgi:hypothetical protein